MEGTGAWKLRRYWAKTSVQNGIVIVGSKNHQWSMSVQGPVPWAVRTVITPENVGKSSYKLPQSAGEGGEVDSVESIGMYRCSLELPQTDSSRGRWTCGPADWQHWLGLLTLPTGGSHQCRTTLHQNKIKTLRCSVTFNTFPTLTCS